MITIDKKVKEKDFAILDNGYSNSITVYVHRLCSVFATISEFPDSPQWDVMRDRLKAINNG